MSGVVAKLLRKRTPAERLAFMRSIAAGRAKQSERLSEIVGRAATLMELGVAEAIVERADIESADAKRLKAAIRGKAKKVRSCAKTSSGDSVSGSEETKSGN